MSTQINLRIGLKMIKGLLFYLVLIISPFVVAKEPNIERKISKGSSQSITELVEEDIDKGSEFQESDLDVAGYKIKLKGFFSAAGGVTTAKQYTSTTTGNLVNPLYYGLGKQLTFESDSLAGLQLNAPVSESTEVVLQIVARGRAVDNVTDKYELNTTWAYLNYHVRDNLSIKVGRVLTPAYLLSQYADVAYAYPWIKPPQEIYGSVPVPSSNGIIATWDIPISNNWQLGVEPFYIANITKTPYVTGLSDLDLTNFLGLGLNLSNDWLKLVAVYMSGNLKLNQGNPISIPVSSSVTLTLPGLNTMTSYLSLGLRAEKNKFLVLSEYALRRSPGSYLRDVQSWYALVGYQIKKAMPYVTYAQINSLNKQRIEILSAPLQAIMSNVLFQEQRSVEVGIRVDVADNIALKASATHITPLNGTRGLFTAIPTQKSVNVYNAGLNLVF